MIYRFTFFLVFVLNSWVALAQPGNLVENPSFEFRAECDDNDGSLEQAPPWFNPTGATPDLFHECAIQLEDPCPYPNQVFLDPWLFGVPTNILGCQEPRSGVGYSGVCFYYPGILPTFDYREYLGVQLTEPLISGETYLVRFYVSRAERNPYAVYALQVHFSPNQISEPTSEGYLNLIPQLSNADGNFIHDEENWVELSWEYTADGTESYMYIGNFESNLDIDIEYTLPDSVDPLFYYEASYYYIDDVYVGTEILNTEFENNPFFKLWPNPTSKIFQIESKDQIIKRIELISPMGQLIFEKGYYSGQNRVSMNVSNYDNGLYLVRVYSDKYSSTTKLLID